MKTNSRILPAIIFIGLIAVFFFGCKKDDKDEPKPISITVSITPATVASGGSIQYTVTITNLGEAIVITRVHAQDSYISGWAKGQTPAEVDLSTTDISFADSETKTVYNQTLGPLTNTGPNAVGIRNTVTAYYEGGYASGSTTYTINNAKKKSGVNRVHSLANNPVVETL